MYKWQNDDLTMINNDSNRKKMMLRIASSVEKFVAQKEWDCFYPGCGCKAIKSHSQQRRGALSAIAKHGKVITMSRDPTSTLARSSKYEYPKARFFEQDISKASVFNGFCNYHDTELFGSIERRPLVKDDPEQILALYRRAVSYEYVREEEGMLSLRCQAMALGIEGEDYQLPASWARQQEMLLDSDDIYYITPMWEDGYVSELHWVWRVLPGNLNVSVVSMLPPISEEEVFRETDPFWDWDRKIMACARPATSFTVIPGVKESHVVMIWTKFNDKYMDEYKRRLLSSDIATVKGLLNEVVFTKSEDYCVSPNLWKRLSASEKDLLSYAIIKDNIRGPLQHMPNVIR